MGFNISWNRQRARVTYTSEVEDPIRIHAGCDV